MRANQIKKGKQYRSWYGVIEVIEPNVFKCWGDWHHAFKIVVPKNSRSSSHLSDFVTYRDPNLPKIRVVNERPHGVVPKVGFGMFGVRVTHEPWPVPQTGWQENASFTTLLTQNPAVAPSSLFEVELDDNGNNKYTKTQLEQRKKTVEKELKKQEHQQKIETFVNTLIGLGANNASIATCQKIRMVRNGFVPEGTKIHGICIPYSDIDALLPVLTELFEKQVKELHDFQ